MGHRLRADAGAGFLDLLEEPTSRGELPSRVTRVDRDPNPSQLSFADLLTRIEAAESLTPVAKRDLKSSLTRMAKWLNRELAETPADPAWLREQMADWNGARFGISDGSFTVVLSQLRRALRLTVPPRVHRSKTPLLPDWACLDIAMRVYWVDYRKARDLPVGNNWLAIGLARFIRWCSEHAISPDTVRDQTIIIFIDEIAQTELRGRINEKEIGLRKAWNHAVKHIPGWPDAPVAPTRRTGPKPLVALPEKAFPASFIAEINAYCANLGFLRVDDPTDESNLTYLERLRRRRSHYRARLPDGQEAFARQLRPLAPVSLQVHRRVLLMTATALVDRNIKRLEDIRAIVDVACLDGAACVVDALEARRGSKLSTSPYPASLVTTLLSVIARCRLEIDPDELSAIRELEAELVADHNQPKDELTAKNRTRLAQFDDADNFALLISCSEAEMHRLEAARRRKGHVTLAMARRAEAAIGNLILCSLPVRRRTLATTDWTRNFRAPSRRGGTATLVYFPDQTKTKRALQVVLESWKCTLLDLYWRHYRPLLQSADRSSYLFPGKTATGHKAFSSLARSIVQFVKRRTGLVMNLHLWRHLMGAALLEEHRDVHLVEELLGHVPGSRATRRYIELKAKWSAQALDEITDARRPRGRYLHVKRQRRFDRRRVPD